MSMTQEMLNEKQKYPFILELLERLYARTWERAIE
jgi:hypothetical protein